MDYSSTQDVAVKTLDWNFSTTEVFGHFAEHKWAVLLDSANAEHPNARYDIMSYSPVATLVTRGELTEITHINATGEKNLLCSREDPFSLLARTIKHYFPISQSVNLPFSGGALGSFSYDLGRRVESLPHIAQQDIALPEMNVGLYTWALIYDRCETQWSLVHYHGSAALESTLAEIESQLSVAPTHTHFSLTHDWQPQISQHDYSEKFDTVQRYLHSGDCYQINLTQRFDAQYQGDEWQAYLKLRASNKAPFSAFIRLPQHSILSISPERFIQLNGSDIETKPIKGTLPRSSDPVLDKLAAATLAASEKDRAENVMIVDLLRNDIGKVAQAGSVGVPHLFDIESFPAVHHLVSTVTAKLDSRYSGCDLLRAAFPGGSITGAPKIRAMEIIEELEPSRRSIYCGTIGYISQDGKMDTNITIRTLVTEDQHIYCWAGGGIVADSNVDAEYQESYDKVSRILPILSK
ncbi:aminodeoxychorismate synthase component I [Shewanella colwelliana]|uniref:aminodeoxychorismate synthase n=1 Tax=Shewanella colwelliana TaxID=23 RepID=A0ABQ4NTX4_SHECO|nr:aminodeoxychorismate synthase component I [Shewanella colwelliana]GIU34447.1 aminodeoxychorismate synthase, component I [Shewanella colwelliana]